MNTWLFLWTKRQPVDPPTSFLFCNDLDLRKIYLLWFVYTELQVTTTLFCFYVNFLSILLICWGLGLFFGECGVPLFSITPRFTRVIGLVWVWLSSPKNLLENNSYYDRNTWNHTTVCKLFVLVGIIETKQMTANYLY